MPEWYETPPEQRTDEQKVLAQQAYYLTLLATTKGREVVCDMKRRVAEKIETSAFDPNCAVAQIWLESFITDTLFKCGVDNPMELTNVQAKIAKSYIHKEKKSDVPEGYAE